MLNIITHPNEILRKRAFEIKEPVTEEILLLAKNMAETVNAAQGLGLAGPQVNELKRICAIASSAIKYNGMEKETKKYLKNFLGKDKDLVLINPKIIERSKAKEWGEEGCLSVPKVYGEVERNKSIKVESFTTDGQRLIFIALDFFARVIQHEVDHLNGILFIDKARSVKTI